MTIETIQVGLGGGESFTLEDVEFEHLQPPHHVATSAQGDQTLVLQPGEVRIKTDRFEGWEEAQGFVVDDKYYEVRRLFNSPRAEGGWLIYPVAPR